MCLSSSQGLLTDRRHRLWRTIFPSSLLWVCENHICSHCLWALHLEAVDVKTAFLYGKLDEKIYMQQPEGFVQQGHEKLVLRLNRAIYGLKQAALAWWKELEASMKRLGFTWLHSDAGVFHHKQFNVVVIAYVDDCIFAGKNKSNVLKLKI